MDRYGCCYYSFAAHAELLHLLIRFGSSDFDDDFSAVMSTQVSTMTLDISRRADMVMRQSCN